MKKLVHVLPFMESEELKDLAKKIINKEIKGVKILLLYPFLKRDDLNEIVDLLLENKMERELEIAIPFLSDEKIIKLYERVQSGEITGIRETAFIPFLGKDKLKEMFDKLVKEANDNPEDSYDELDIKNGYFGLDDDDEE